MRLLRRVTTILVLLAVVLLALELAAPPWITKQIDARVHERTHGVLTVDATLGGFPVLTRLAATGAFGPLDLDVTRISGQQVPVDELAFTLERIRLDRQALLTGDVEVTDLGPGTLTIRQELPQAALAALRTASGAVDVTVTDGGLRIGLPVVGAVEVPLPKGLLPCTPQPEIGETAVTLTCAFDRAPPVLQQLVTSQTGAAPAQHN